MALKFNSILIFSADPKKLADFYANIFADKPEWEDGGYSSFKIGGNFITIGPHDKVKGKNSGPERIMFNLETRDVKGEFERMQKAGATVIAKPYQMSEDPTGGWIATLADPDGNYFQLVTPWEN
jgi:predicted enzyme related to lactoylglutathione lyase